MVGSAKQLAVYILASKRNGTLYVGVTSKSGATWIWQHREATVEGFTIAWRALACLF